MKRFLAGLAAVVVAVTATAGEMAEEELYFAATSLGTQYGRFLKGKNDDFLQFIRVIAEHEKMGVAIVTPDELAQAAGKNALAAKKKYEKKLIVIRGKVDGVDDTFGLPSVSFSTSEFIPVTAVLVRGTKDADETVAQAEKLNKGDLTALVCARASFSVVPTLSFCRFVHQYMSPDFLYGDLKGKTHLKKLDVLYNALKDGVTMNIIATSAERAKHTVPKKDKAYLARVEKHKQEIENRISELFTK